MTERPEGITIEADLSGARIRFPLPASVHPLSQLLYSVGVAASLGALVVGGVGFVLSYSMIFVLGMAGWLLGLLVLTSRTATADNTVCGEVVVTTADLELREHGVVTVVPLDAITDVSAYDGLRIQVGDGVMVAFEGMEWRQAVWVARELSAHAQRCRAAARKAGVDPDAHARPPQALAALLKRL